LFLPRPRATQNPWPLSGRWQLAFQDNLITSATGSATEHSQEKPVSGCDSNAAHLGSSKRMERQSPVGARYWWRCGKAVESISGRDCSRHGWQAGRVAITTSCWYCGVPLGVGTRGCRYGKSFSRWQRVFRASDLEACRSVQFERSARKIRRNKLSDFRIGLIVPDQRDHLARGRSVHI